MGGRHLVAVEGHVGEGYRAYPVGERERVVWGEWLQENCQGASV